MMHTFTKKSLSRWGWMLLLAVILVVSFYQLITLGKNDIQVPEFLRFLVEPTSNPGWFLGLVSILPMLGFPMSAFCLLAGMKFGLTLGTLIIGVAMVLHILLAYWLGHSYLKEPLHRWLDKRGYSIGRMPEQHQLKYAITFVALPLVPYAAKNYLLAMSRLRLSYFLAVSWPIQMLYSFPLIAITGAVQEGNPTLFIISIIGLAVLYGIYRWARSGKVPGIRKGGQKARSGADTRTYSEKDTGNHSA